VQLGHDLTELIAKLFHDVRGLGATLLDLANAALEGARHPLNCGVRVLEALQGDLISLARCGAALGKGCLKVLWLGAAMVAATSAASLTS
jgi:hypothetical protein